MRFRSVVSSVSVFVAVMLTTVPVALAPQNNGQANASMGNTLVVQQMAAMPLAFTENKGQWDERVLFRASTGGTTLWFGRDGITYQFTHRVPRSKTAGTEPLAAGVAPRAPFDRTERDSIETVVVQAAFVGADPHVELVGEGPLGYRCNYFRGNEPGKWQTDVPNYAAVVYRDVYPGVDVRYEGKGGALTCSYTAASESDLAQVKFNYEGNVAVTETGAGQLRVEAPWGAVLEPFSSGQAGGLAGNAAPVAASAQEANGAASVTLEYSTYLGGSSDEMAIGIAVDQAGSAYVTGGTYSPDFPTQNPYDGSYNGYYDVFVTKLSLAGNALEYSTYLGGSDLDEGDGIAVDQAGSAYVMGYTGSSDFPTQDPYDGSYNGGADVFVTKLSPAGNALEYSTYLGGSNLDRGGGVEVDQAGSAYVTGWTSSTDFPTQNPYDGSFNGGTYDVFVTKMSPTGNALVYGTYLGGGADDRVWGIAVDQAGSAYVTGHTSSTDFPTQNPYDGSYNGGEDVFVTKFSPTGNALVYSTFLGGSSTEAGYGVAVDQAGSAYVTGWTSSTDFPTQNPYDGTYNGGVDVFVTKLVPAGNALMYSTFLGGSLEDEGNGVGIAVDASGSAYVTGWTYSSDFPTQNPYDGTYNGGSDVFVTKFSPAGNALVYSTYLGGSSVDAGYGIAVDQAGSAYVTGYTSSTDFPTQNPYDGSYNGSEDVFVTKISADGVALDPVITDLLDAGTGSDLVLKWTQPDKTGVTDYWVYWGTSQGIWIDSAQRFEGGRPSDSLRIPGLTEHTPYYVGIRAHNGSTDQYSAYATLLTPVRPTIPVVLVHGWNSGPEIWDIDPTSEDALGWLSGAGFSNVWLASLIPCGPPDEKDFKDNANLLANFISDKIAALKSSTGHPEIEVSRVDIVAHSMGGLVVRRYVSDQHPLWGAIKRDVRRLIMLGSPNGGISSAKAGGPFCPTGPAAGEMGEGKMKKFNTDYPMNKMGGTEVWAAAGTGGYAICIPGGPPLGNAVDRHCNRGLGGYWKCPNDGLVRAERAYSSIDNSSWVIPEGRRKTGTWCHSTYGNPNANAYYKDNFLFTNWIIPILKTGNPSMSEPMMSGGATTDESGPQYLLDTCRTLVNAEQTEDTLWILDGSFSVALTATDTMITFSLRSPSGVTYAGTANDSSVIFDIGDGLQIAHVLSPAPGAWGLVYNTLSMVNLQAEVCITVASQTDLTLGVRVDDDYLYTSDSTIVSVTLQENGGPLSGAAVVMSGVRDDVDTIPPISLLDNGQGADIAINDGIYSAWFSPNDTGVTELTVTASGAAAGGSEFRRIGHESIYASRGSVARGDMNRDGIYNVLDVVALINRVFRGAAPPYPDFIADVTCDGVANVLDVVRLINSVFRGAPIPRCP